jgi:pantoate--beta-alanine ligase
MGALHEGHMSLITEAKERCGTALATIFVNPMQFNNGTDLGAYPRAEEEDLAALEEAGADACFLPTADELYPSGFASHIDTAIHNITLESQSRPGHFKGVCTGVGKLVNLARPEAAFFGQKDFVQCAVIDRFARDLDFGVDVVSCPTIRADDGLALSSRNRRLTEEQRSAAPVVHRALLAGKAVYDGLFDTCEDGPEGVASARVITAILDELRTESAASLDCCGIAAVESLRELQSIPVGDAAVSASNNAFQAPAVLHLAAFFGDVRLIDNVALVPPSMKCGTPQRM